MERRYRREAKLNHKIGMNASIVHIKTQTRARLDLTVDELAVLYEWLIGVDAPKKSETQLLIACIAEEARLMLCDLHKTP